MDVAASPAPTPDGSHAMPCTPPIDFGSFINDALLMRVDGSHQCHKGHIDVQRICDVLKCRVVQRLPCVIGEKLGAFEVWVDDAGHCKYTVPNDRATRLTGATLYGPVLITRPGIV